MPQNNIFRVRNAVLLAKVESTPNVDAVPAATDAMNVMNLQPGFNPNMIQTDEYTGSLDGNGPIYAGMTATFSFDVYLKGSGAAGTAPEFGKLLRACGMSESILATALPAAPEACAAGGSTTSAVLGASAAATAQLYRGMPILFSGTVAGQSFISDYTAAKTATLTDTMGGAIIASTSYQILANVLYGPASNSIPTLTLAYYLDGVLYKFTGCTGTWELTTDTNGVGKIRFTFNGIFASKTDTALISNPVFDATRPPPFQNGRLLMNRLPAAASQFGLTFGANMTFPEDPNQPEGVQPPIHTDRRITGTIDPLETLVATRDIMGDFRSGTRRIIHARYGSVAGNRIGITIPAGQYTNQSPGDRNGLSKVDVPFEATGKDAGAFLCFY